MSIEIDTQDLGIALEEVFKLVGGINDRGAVELNEKLALYFHFSSMLLTTLLDFADGYLGVMITQSAISTGLEGVAIVNTIAEAKEAYKQKQWGAFVSYMTMIPIMTASKIEEEARKYMAKTQQDENNALRNEIARYTL